MFMSQICNERASTFFENYLPVSIESCCANATISGSLVLVHYYCHRELRVYVKFTIAKDPSETSRLNRSFKKLHVSREESRQCHFQKMMGCDYDLQGYYYY